MNLCLHAESQGTDKCPFNLTSPGIESREPVWCPVFTGNTSVKISCLCLDTRVSVCLSIYLSIHPHTQGCCARSFSFHSKESLLK